jgi:hypothetical protein
VFVDGVMLTDGFPPFPLLDFTKSNGAVRETPLNDDAPSRSTVVVPATVTDIVFAPVVVATKYQISVSILLVRVLVAFVNAPPFHEAEVIDPVPATLWTRSAVSTICSGPHSLDTNLV